MTINSFRRSFGFIAFTLLIFIETITIFGQNPNTERGLSGHSYLSSDFDHVNLYNGNIGLTVPLSGSYKVGGNLEYQMTLVYNTNIWDFKVENQPDQGGERVKAFPDAKSNAGLGWRLSFGTLYPPNTPVYNEENNYLYVAPDGSQHNFFAKMGTGETQRGALFSGEGALMRLRTDGPLRIEFPDGQVHYFGSNFLLTKIEDQFGNKVEVDMTSNPLAWEVKDKCATCSDYGHKHTIEFDSPGGQVIRASLSAQQSGTAPFGRAIYDFNYEPRQLQRHNKNTWIWPPDQLLVNVKLLKEIKFPANAGSYKFDYNPNGFNPPGAVRSATLPTGGHYKWGYTQYQRPIRRPEDPVCIPYCPDELDPISSTDGIAYKEIYDQEVFDPNTFAAHLLGKFEYNPGGMPQGSGSALADTAVIVKSPNGDETVNYFNQSFDEFGWPEQAFGLPFTRLSAVSSPNGTLYLSQEMYKGTVAGGQKLRSVYVRYALDPRPDSGLLNANYLGSPRVEEQRTVYEDGKQAGQFFSNWNGLGKFRQTQTNGTFDSGNVRSSFTDYSGAIPALNQPWILNLYTEQSETEGANTAKTQYCFESATGFLKIKRVMIGANPNTRDILLERVRNDNGEVTSEKYFGGDVKHNAPTGGICGLNLVNPEYQIDHTYSFGSLATSKYVGTTFFSVDNVIDQNTGLIATSRDSAGVATSYQYDALGRITNVDAANDADEVYTYNPATDSLGAQTIIDYKKRSDGSGLSRKKVTYDPFGRPSREEGRMPDGSFSARETKYNAMGWTLSVSEAGALDKLTQYSNFDPFGRAGTVTSSDGTVSTIAYAGVSSVEKTSSIGTSVNAAGTVSTSNVKRNEFYDRQGRLVEVKEGSGPNNTMVPTDFTYDVGKRLKSVQTAVDLTPASPKNVALASNNASITAAPAANGNFAASAVIDGERAGRNWGTSPINGGWNDSTQGDYSHDWVRVDFGGMKTINEIDVYTLSDRFSGRTDDPSLSETFNTASNTGYGITSFDVQYLNGSGWVTLDCGNAANPCGRVYDNNKVRRQFTFAPVQTTAVRVAVHGSVPWASANYSRIVEVEAWGYNSGNTDQVWVEDSVPAGGVAVGDAEGWNWVSANPSPFSGTAAHSSNIVAGPHQHYFYNATQKLTINAGDKLFADVFLDPANPPSEVMLQWGDPSWEHRAYWGSNQLPWGIDGTVGRRYMGPLPAAGQWVRLEVPAAIVGMEGHTADAMAFSLYGGRATWDRAGKTAGTSSQTNLAAGKAASQSSTVIGAAASRAVDGNRDGNFANGSVTHTDAQNQSWWQVDLGSSQPVQSLSLWNRTDCACPERLENFYVLVSDQPFASTDLTATLHQPGVSSYYTPGGAGPTMSIAVGRTARYVRVQLAGANFLSLAEVEVYAGVLTNMARAASGGAASASSTYNSIHSASSVIDGDRTGRNWGVSAAGGGWNDATENQFASDWMQVNFSGQKTINEIDLYTLRDGYAGRTDDPTAGETFSTTPNAGQGITSFEVQYLSGGVWTNIPGGRVVTNNKVWRKFTFGAITTGAIRVLVRDGSLFTTTPNNYSRIVEIEAYEVASSSQPQATQTRTFNYDNRGFLTSETHPEITGTVNYGLYDTRGNMGQKIEGASNVLYSYDAAGRPLSLKEGTGDQRLLKEFEYYTDNAPGDDDGRRGKLKKATRVNWILNPYAANPGTTEMPVKISEEYTYRGKSGRLDSRLTKLNSDNPTPYQFYQTFSYNELGNVQNQSYPQCQNATCVNNGAAVPRTVKYEYEQGFLNRVWSGNAASPVNYAQSITYHQNQVLNTVVHGNGVTDTYERSSANGMNRPHKIRFNGSNVNWDSGEYKYDGIGNVINIGTDWFVYDQANRIVEGTAGVNGSNQRRKQQYSYDGFGNVLNFTTTQNGHTVPFTNSVDAGTNRLAGLYYDNSGNFQGVSAPNLYVYDQLNMMKKAPGKTYLYGPNEERIWIVDKQYNDLGPAPSPAPPIVQTVTLRGLNNEVLREYQINGVDAAPNWAWKKDYVYRGRQMLASEAPTGKRHYHLDHLGSARIVTNDAGSQVEAYQYFPYGAEAVSTGGERLKFTGHERDYATNGGHDLDYMHARYYSMNNGRFINVDPGRDFDAKKPQSWNRYSYTRGNPINSTDPDGKFMVLPNGGGQAFRQTNTNSFEDYFWTLTGQSPGLEETETEKLNRWAAISEIDSEFPKSEFGIYSYTTEGAFGQNWVVENLTVWAKYWAECGNPDIGIGPVSSKGGGTVGDHKLHREGLSIDIRPMRKDARNLPTSIGQSTYDRDKTNELIQLFRQLPGIRTIYFNDSTIEGTTPSKGHSNHMHLEFYPVDQIPD